MIAISKVVEISILNHKGSLRNCLNIKVIRCITVNSIQETLDFYRLLTNNPCANTRALQHFA